MSVLLLIDTSGSIAAKLTKIRAAAASLVSQGCVDDEWAVVEFKAAPILRQDFTTNTVLVGSALNALSPDGPTALLDAIRFSMDHLDRRARHQQKIVVLVTDGDEQHSKSTRREVIERLRVSNIHFYAIGFPEGSRPIDSDSLISRAVSLQAEALAKKLLEEMGQTSKNGRAFFPQKTSELEGVANSIISDLRSPTYRFTYYSTNRISAATSSGNLQVKLKPPQKGGELTARICGIYEVPDAHVRAPVVSK